MNPPARAKLLPRHRTGKMDLIGGTGPITQMSGVYDFMEVDKTDQTFRVQTPEDIDPEETGIRPAPERVAAGRGPRLAGR
jgi:hypothetical protein